LKPFSLFNYYDMSGTVIEEGVAMVDVSVQLAVALIALLLAILSFQRRDLTVGAWPWQRARRAKSATP